MSLPLRARIEDCSDHCRPSMLFSNWLPIWTGRTILYPHGCACPVRTGGLLHQPSFPPQDHTGVPRTSGFDNLRRKQAFPSDIVNLVKTDTPQYRVANKIYEELDLMGFVAGRILDRRLVFTGGMQ